MGRHEILMASENSLVLHILILDAMDQETCVGMQLNTTLKYLCCEISIFMLLYISI